MNSNIILDAATNKRFNQTDFFFAKPYQQYTVKPKRPTQNNIKERKITTIILKFTQNTVTLQQNLAIQHENCIIIFTHNSHYCSFLYPKTG